jgi:hypothetical protein
MADVDPNRLAVYEDAFLALDWAVEADDAGDIAEATRLRNLATMVIASVPADAPAADLPDDW